MSLTLTVAQIAITQHFLSRVGMWPKEKIDGVANPLLAARIKQAHDGSRMQRWPKERQAGAYLQQILMREGLYGGEQGGEVDGYAGQITDYGAEVLAQRLELPGQDPNPEPGRQDEVEDLDPHNKTTVDVEGLEAPTYGGLTRVFGKPGRVQLERVDAPYKIVWDWDIDTEVKSFSTHTLIAERVHAVLVKVLEVYGKDEIRRLGLDRFGGCYNPRRMRGGSRWSTHAWGIALDWHPSRNRLRQTATQAAFGKDKAYSTWFDIWGAAGFRSLGILRNYDWMHLQYCRTNEKAGAPYGPFEGIAHHGPGHQDSAVIQFV